MSKAAILRMRKKLEAEKKPKQAGQAEPTIIPRSASSSRGSRRSRSRATPSSNPPFTQQPTVEVKRDIATIEELLRETKGLLADGGKNVWVAWLNDKKFNEAAKEMARARYIDVIREK